LQLLVGPLRKWDLKASTRPDYFIANSTAIQSDIKKYYGRESVVIHPPVNVEKFESRGSSYESRNGFVTVGRLVPYKRVDLIIEACNKLQLPLTVVGRGPDLGRLQKMAGSTVSFDTDASDEAVVEYMGNSAAFLFAADEDFGITPVEALAAGTPVIAFKSGGALDYIVPGKTGEFFEEQTIESLAATLKNFDPKKYDSTELKSFAQQFSAENFTNHIYSYLKKIFHHNSNN
jgi:glycosyltransferase involved in cell wall biosynthesis